MNEILKELYTQAVSYVVEHNDISENVHSFQDRVNQKFAELIIDDCCEVIIQSDPNPKMILHEPYGTIMYRVLDHFGIRPENS